MPQGTRVFIAFTVPEPLERKLSLLQDELASPVRQCRWSALPYHVTLAFLGNVPDIDLNALYQKVTSEAASVEPLQLEVKGLGIFPPTKRPRVICAGITASRLELLLDMQASIVRSLARIGHLCDERLFHPHVTLGRLKHQRVDTGNLTGLIEHYRLWSAGEFTVKEIQVFASVLGPTAAEYKVLARCPLRD